MQPLFVKNKEMRVVHSNEPLPILLDTAKPLVSSAFASAKFTISSSRTFLKR